MTDLRAAVKGLYPIHDGKWETWTDREVDAFNDAKSRVLALIPEGAVLVTEEGLARAMHAVGAEEGADPATPMLYPSDSAAILRHLRETP